VRVRFWGVRGSLPTPGIDTVRYGGNTACIDLRTSDGQVIIIDAGTGIRNLGKALPSELPLRFAGYILLSHTHWDHIQGLPFFYPLLVRGNQFTIVGRKRPHRRLEDILSGQFLEPYLPFAYRSLAANMVIREVESGETIQIGRNISITMASLNHPGGCLGFRIVDNGTIFAYCSDTGHEPGKFEDGVLGLAKDADLLIHDAHFADMESTVTFADWGHSCWHQAVGVAQAANVHSLGLFHYAPELDDDSLEKILIEARREFMNTFLTREGLEISLPLGANLP
jgi:phosphoribosyl 1,2-cyclic phosphodiesterase